MTFIPTVELNGGQFNQRYVRQNFKQQLCELYQVDIEIKPTFWIILFTNFILFRVQTLLRNVLQKQLNDVFLISIVEPCTIKSITELIFDGHQLKIVKHLSCFARPLFVVACQCPFKADILTKSSHVTPGHSGMSAEDFMRSLWTMRCSPHWKLTLKTKKPFDASFNQNC